MMAEEQRRRALWRQIPVLPTLISVAVVVSSGLSVAPIRDAATLGDVTEAYLVRSLGYVAIAPVSGVLDTLTLLSLKQHGALLVSVLVWFGAWRAAANRGAGWRRHLGALVGLVATIGIVYAAAALLPRPMAALGADNANIVKIDFHAHTTASHDGHQGVEALREWHRRAGFDVAYVTDHASVAGAERGVAANPRPVGTGVTLLQSIETSWAGEHVSIPGAQRVYRGILTANLASVDTQGLRLAGLIPGREPVVIWNHPRDLAALSPATPDTLGIQAIEIVNGSPKDMDRVRPNRSQIVAMAQGRDLALTVGSDNHGFGRVAPGWTLMVIVAWRGAGANDLATAIDRAIRTGGFGATRVVERRVADPGGNLAALVASVVTVPYRMLTTLSGDERVSWILWTWAVAGIAALWRHRRRREAA